MQRIAGWHLLIVAGSIIALHIQEVFPSTAAALAARSASVLATARGDEEISELQARVVVAVPEERGSGSPCARNFWVKMLEDLPDSAAGRFEPRVRAGGRDASRVQRGRVSKPHSFQSPSQRQTRAAAAPGSGYPS